MNPWDEFWKGYNIKDIDSWAKRRIIGILSGYVHRGMYVLDLGSGTGYFSAYFISEGCEVYSMDYSDKALAITRDITKNRSKAYIKRSILDKDLVSDIGIKFDIIFTDGLLEHYSLKEQEGIIANMKNLKKENGYIINFVPNRFSLWSIVRPFYIRIKERPFIMRDFFELHTRNNLDVVSYGGISVLPFRISPERMLGRYFGMLFYCVAV